MVSHFTLPPVVNFVVNLVKIVDVAGVGSTICEVDETMKLSLYVINFDEVSNGVDGKGQSETRNHSQMGRLCLVGKVVTRHAIDPEHFTITMYHGGRFSDNFYVGGWMVKHLGYMDGIILYHYKVHGSSNAMTLLQFDDNPLAIIPSGNGPRSATIDEEPYEFDVGCSAPPTIQGSKSKAVVRDAYNKARKGRNILVDSKKRKKIVKETFTLEGIVLQKKRNE
ncbi:unnamed protein product [Prunus armeniaca]